MMHTIHRFPISIEDIQTIQLPVDAEILTVQVKSGSPQVWVKLDTSAPKIIRHFTLYGTGHAVPPKTGKYIGTFQLYEGSLIFHLFEDF